MANNTPKTKTPEFREALLVASGVKSDKAKVEVSPKPTGVSVTVTTSLSWKDLPEEAVSHYKTALKEAKKASKPKTEHPEVAVAAE